MTYTNVYETRDGQRTGTSHGFTTREQAEEYVASHRHARDNDPVWSEYKRQGMDWVIPPEHIDYPHEPGFMIDCPRCEWECNCTATSAECVWTGHAS